jgi:hypothetical protein
VDADWTWWDSGKPMDWSKPVSDNDNSKHGGAQ